MQHSKSSADETMTEQGSMSVRHPIWKKDELEREKFRALLVIAVVGTVIAARFFEVLPSFTKDFELMDWVDVLYIFVLIWVGYLFLMVFAVSDDVLGSILGAYGRAISFFAKLFGHVAFTVAPLLAAPVALYVSWMKDWRRTIVLVVVLLFILVLLWAQRRRVAGYFPPENQ